MGKRSNEHGQVRKEDLEYMMNKSSEAPKGPFETASKEVMKKRRIIRAGNKFKRPSAASAGKGAPGNSIFSSVSLSAAPATGTGGSGSGNPFGGFSFGAAAPAHSAGASVTTAKPAFPSFAMPSPKPTSVVPKPSTNTKPTGLSAESEGKLVDFTNGFLEFVQNARTVDTPDYERFIATFNDIAGLKMAATKHQKFIGTSSATKSKSSTAAAAAASSSTATWDSSRPLFGGAKPLVSPTEGSAKKSTTDSPAPAAGGFSFNTGKSGAASPAPAAGAFSFGKSSSASPAPAAGGFSFNTGTSSAASPAPAAGGFSFGKASTDSSAPAAGGFSFNTGTASATSPAPATGGFSFNSPNTGKAAAPVPAFSFSTTQSAAVQAAAEKANNSNSAPKSDGAGHDTNEGNDEEAGGPLEAADDNYEVLYKTKTKILHVAKNRYIKGLLKIEKEKESGKNRIVVRDGTTGKVKMNSSISKGMPLSKSIVPATKKKGPTPIVLIKAMLDEESTTPEDFKIITAKEDQENLYNELKKLV